MAKFKVGDRVRWTVDTDSWQDVTLTGFTMGSWDGADPKYGEGAFSEDALELIPPPIPAPIVERMRGLIERIGQGSNKYWQHEAEARAIMAELVPVDPDLLEARRIAMEETADQEWKKQIIDGICDENPRVAIALAGIRKGRELEREGR